MQYLHVKWYHNYEDEPLEFYMELNNDRFQEKVLEIFKDKSKAYATLEEEQGTFLGKIEYPEVDELNTSEEFKADIISKETFDFFWKTRDD